MAFLRVILYAENIAFLDRRRINGFVRRFVQKVLRLGEFQVIGMKEIKLRTFGNIVH